MTLESNINEVLPEEMLKQIFHLLPLGDLKTCKPEKCSSSLQSVGPGFTKLKLNPGDHNTLTQVT